VKLGCVISTPDVVRKGPLALLTGNFEEKLAKAKQLGFHGVELMVRDPGQLDVRQVKNLLNLHDLEVPQIVTGELFGMDGVALVHPDPTICNEALKRTRAVIRLAGALGAGTIVNIGRLRGRIDWLSTSEQTHATELFIDAFRYIADYAADYQVRITLEPCNRYEVDFVHNAADALMVIDRVRRANFGVMLDLFHMNIEDDSIEGSLRSAIPVLWHIHIADSNRKAPGQGHLDFAKIIQTLSECGYDGYLSGEMLPVPDADTAARQTVEYMRKWIH
jgi:sugar phosphate isomerase/epimerase